MRAVFLTLTALGLPAVAFAQDGSGKEPLLLDPIILTPDSSVATSIQDAPVSITVIDQDRLQSSGARDVRDVLRMAPCRPGGPTASLMTMSLIVETVDCDT